MAFPNRQDLFPIKDGRVIVAVDVPDWVQPGRNAMGRITLESGVRAKLRNLSEELELCDEAGQTMGRFLPEAVYKKLLYSLALAQRPSLSAEEIERRKQESGGKPLAEILKQLGAS